MFFFFKQKTAYEMRISDWSSDVCSSDLTFGRNADAPVSIRFQGRTYDNLSARATIAHSRYRQSVHLAYDYAIRSAQFGFAAWLSGLFLFHGTMRRRLARALQARVITGTRVHPETKLANLPHAEARPHALTIPTDPTPTPHAN